MKAEIQPFRRLNLTVSMWLEAFSIIIVLSHKILWEEFRIKTNHKGRLRIAAFQSYNSKDYALIYLIAEEEGENEERVENKEALSMRPHKKCTASNV